MDYFELYNLLSEKINQPVIDTDIDEFVNVQTYSFESENFNILQGNAHMHCDIHDMTFYDEPGGVDLEHPDHELDLIDSEVIENKRFYFHIFVPLQEMSEKEAILLLHGFNEKSWTKYLPWAYYLAKECRQCVILCPIAFHMNRALASWSDRHKMHEVSACRKEQYPNLLQSSFSNVAISTRLQAKPQRFIWSGLQTYYDIVQFIRQCKEGRYPPLNGNMQFHLFSYSIGAFLAEIIKFTNPGGYFTNSKLMAFCGGPTFNRLTPVSKAILDSEANVALYSYLVEHLESHLKHDKKLFHYIGGEHPEGKSFRMMLDFKVERVERERVFRQISSQVFAVALEQDRVVPVYDVINTLKGAAHDIPTQVVVIDFDYPYTHENPFVLKESIRTQVDAAYRHVFGLFRDFLLNN